MAGYAGIDNGYARQNSALAHALEARGTSRKTKDSQYTRAKPPHAKISSGGLSLYNMLYDRSPTSRSLTPYEYRYCTSRST